MDGELLQDCEEESACVFAGDVMDLGSDIVGFSTSCLDFREINEDSE
jgi:hypothetical protein